jgi:hypothetical protein
LPSVTLGKAVAECEIAFAVCLEHTAKKLIPVVLRLYAILNSASINGSKKGLLNRPTMTLVV